MSNLKFSPDLFLEVAEMERFKKFLDQDGFRKNILDNSVSFGLIKSNKDLAFTNARVERDLDTVLGQKTIKIRAISAIDTNGRFLASPEINGIPVPADDSWYWVRIKYAFTNNELGTISLAINGDMVGVGTEFTKVLRGMPNFPSRIKFPNSVYNTGEYDVLEVIDDLHATVVHPATNSSGIAEFALEDNLKYQVVGTFTAGTAVPQGNKYPFEYDSCTYELIKETSLNVKPVPYTPGMEFYIARVKVIGSTIVIQDKRTEYWETKGSDLIIDIERNDNPLIGVEAVKWKHPFSPADLNIVEVAWGMRSKNWAVDSSQNLLTLFGSATGGKFKTVDDFTDGDFDNWRLYYANGRYSRVISSVKQGSAINLILDVLDVDNVSNDGGQTFNNTGASADWVLVVPNCEEVILKFDANPADQTVNVNREFAFPVNTLVGICELQVFKDPSCTYNLKYKYQSFKEYTQFIPIPSDDTVGYYDESSFDTAGNLKSSDARVSKTYASDPSAGFIELVLTSYSYRKFSQKVDKGDIIGVQEITDLGTSQTIEMFVGTTKHYLYISGSQTLTDDVYFGLDKTVAIEGNEFRIHFNCTSLTLAGKNIFIVEDYTSGTPTILKRIEIADVYSMLNRDGGIIFTMKYKGNQWVLSQNYDNGKPFEISMFDGDVTEFFDPGLQGKVKGYFGHEVYIVMAGRVPVGYGTITEESGTYIFDISEQGGEIKHKLTKDELPAIDIMPSLYWGKINWGNKNSAEVLKRDGGLHTTGSGKPTSPSGNMLGADLPHNNMQAYYVVAYIKKKY